MRDFTGFIYIFTKEKVQKKTERSFVKHFYLYSYAVFSYKTSDTVLKTAYII